MGQGDQTYTGLTTTGALAVGGTTTTNEIRATAATSSVLFYNTTTTGNINFGTGLTTGRLRIGSGSNSNHIGSVDFQSNGINNTTPTSGNMNIANLQTSGTFNIATNANRTGNINIGNGSSSSATINIGGPNTTTNINGSTVNINSVNQAAANSVSTGVSVALAGNLPSPYFITLTGTLNLVITAPSTPYLGQKIIIYNSTTSSLSSNFTAATAIIVPFGALISAPVATVTYFSTECVTFQWNGSFWIQQVKPNTNTLVSTINYTTFAPTGFNQIGYSESFTSTGAAYTTTGVKVFTQQIVSAFMPFGLYFISVSNRLTAGTTAGNVIITFQGGISTTTTTAGFTFISTDEIPASTSMIASGVVSLCCSGIYTYSAAPLPYNLLSIDITTIAGTGIVPRLTMNVMRIG